MLPACTWTIPTAPDHACFCCACGWVFAGAMAAAASGLRRVAFSVASWLRKRDVYQHDGNSVHSFAIPSQELACMHASVQSADGASSRHADAVLQARQHRQRTRAAVLPDVLYLKAYTCCLAGGVGQRLNKKSTRETYLVACVCALFCNTYVRDACARISEADGHR